MRVTFGDLIYLFSHADIEDKLFDLVFPHRVFLLCFGLLGDFLGHVGKNISIKYYKSIFNNIPRFFSLSILPSPSAYPHLPAPAPLSYFIFLIEPIPPWYHRQVPKPSL